MTRPLLALLALLTLPVLAEAQEQAQATTSSATHTVVRGETLWDLSRTYYGDPFSWRLIHEANRETVPNPHWIYPDQRLIIPGRTPGQAPAQAPAPAPAPVEQALATGTEGVIQEQPLGNAPNAIEMLASERTVFYGSNEVRVRGGEGGFLAEDEALWLSVPRDIFHSAGWLIPRGAVPEHIGTIADFEREGRVRTRRTFAQPYESLILKFNGVERAGVGDRVLTFRVMRSSSAGEVVVPSGILTIHRIDENGAVGVVTTEYDRVSMDDFFIPLPEFTLRLGSGPVEVMDGMSATILEMQAVRDLHGPGDIVFLDRGLTYGLRIGDEFSADMAVGWTSRAAGKLQVIGLQDETASARIIELDGPIFRAGMQLRLSGRLP